MQIPSYTIFTGPMFGGKTTKLLAEIDRLKYRKKYVRLFKPALDDRYAAGAIVSHNGISHKALSVKSGADILTNVMCDLAAIDVVAVDEAFMITGCAEALDYVYARGKSIIVSSLDLSAECDTFREMSLMLPHATKIVKYPAVCVECGADAYYTKCSIKKDSNIVIGGNDIYSAVCFNHHPILTEKYKLGATEIV